MGEYGSNNNCCRGMRLAFAALASTKLPSTDRCLPCTNPTPHASAGIPIANRSDCFNTHV